MSFKILLLIFLIQTLITFTIAAPFLAVCKILRSEVPTGGVPITGSISFSQEVEGQPVNVIIKISGLKKGLHALHIHENGEIKTSCADAGAHYNPFNVKHGDRLSPIRHIGDLGNIEVLADYQETNIIYNDLLIGITGTNLYNIVNKACVVHQGVDDLGLTSSPQSAINGNSGAMLGCGTVVVKGTSYLSSLFILLIMVFVSIM